jgi:hypothetical protein
MLIAERDLRARLRRRTWRRIGEFARRVCLPTVALLFAVVTRFNPVWPIEDYHDLASVFLGGRSLIYFAPLFAYSLFSVGHAILVPDFAGPYRLIRFGVYSGVILTAPISLLSAVSLYLLLHGGRHYWWSDATLFFNLALLVWLLAGRLRWPAWPGVLAVFAVVLIFETLCLMFTPPYEKLRFAMTAIVIVQLAGLFFAAPWVALVTFIRQSARLARRYGEPGQFSLLDLLGTVGWCACYMAALRLAYNYVTRS